MVQRSKQPSEKDIQKSILDFLRLKGIYCWKQHNTGIYQVKTGSYIPSGKRGVADILGILPTGRFLAIEVKRPGGVLGDYQIEFLASIRNNGGLGVCVSSLDEVINLINDTLRKK